MTLSISLKDLSLFAGVPDDQLERFSEHVHRTTVPAGTLLISAQLPGEAVYFILSGSVKHQLLGDDGTELTMAIFGPGDAVGETTLVSRRSRSTSVMTRQETTLLWMDRRDFLRCIDQSHVLSQNLIRHLSDRLRRANERIHSLATLDVTGRVARQILELAERFGKAHPGEGIAIPVSVTQGEIAEMVAATRERVNQVLVRLRKAGVFSVNADHQITVHEPKVLVELSKF